MELISDRHPLIIVVGAGGVGKTTLAAAIGVGAALAGRATLVATFDPSLRLKDTLGVGEEARDREVPVALAAPATLHASLLDARRTFDRLVERYAPDPASRRRILDNRFYQQLSGSLGGILEYMAVERLFEVEAEGRYSHVVLDTPPTQQAVDFLEAPSRIVGFLDSGALKVALRPWFDEAGRLKAAAHWGGLGRRAERFLDEVVGLDLLRDMAEFFQAFSPLYAGFRTRAAEVEELLRSPRTLFLLVAGPGEENVPDTLFFARRLRQAGYHLGPIIVNRVHPRAALSGGAGGAATTPGGSRQPDGRELLAWLGERDHRGLVELGKLLGPDQPLATLPLRPDEPTDLASLAEMSEALHRRLAALT
ncbi:MAG TPA: ArsA-related P-loop ATPase [Thermoanaerobaculia bacterium]|nr:ArsA-related P-loop ATPase [Thermoanaerobaculia bacterium]